MPLDTTPTRPQIRRGNTAPADLSLQPGVLALGYDQRTLYAGVPPAVDPRGLLAFVDIAGLQGALTGYLPLSGGTLTGPLTLAGDPTAPLRAATKQYVDNRYFPLTGGIITGPLVVQKDNYPAIVFHNAAGATIGLMQSDTPNGSTSAALVLQSGMGTTMWLLDTKIWVSFQGGPQYALLTDAGAVMRGPFVLVADPSAPLQAATKQYVDARAGNYLPLTGGTLSGSLTVQGQLNVGVTAPYRLATTAKGNLLLGVAEPSQAATADVTFGGTLFAYRISATSLDSDLYNDGTNWRYRAAGYPVARIALGGGILTFATAPAGAPDAVANLTSALTVDAAGNLSATGNLFANGGNVIAGKSAGNAFVGSYDYRGSNVGLWNSNNVLYFGNADGNGSVQASRAGLDSAGTFSANGHVNVGVNLYIARNAVADWVFIRSGDGWRHHQWRSDGWEDAWNESSGQRLWRNPNGDLMTLDGSGNLNVATTVSAPNVSGTNVNANGSLFIARAQIADFTMWRNAPYRYFQWQSGWYDYFSESDGKRHWVGAAGDYMTLDGAGSLGLLQPNAFVSITGNYFAGGSITVNGSGYKPGGGAWGDSSDLRTKQDIADYAAGLDEVCALRPVTYRHNGAGGTKDTGRVFHGLIAQEAQEPMPELVFEMPEDWPDKLDTQLGIDATPLPFALVNAVRTLRDRVVALEGGAAP